MRNPTRGQVRDECQERDVEEVTDVTRVTAWFNFSLFATLLGTYRWVWDGQRDLPASNDEDLGYLTLSLAGNPSNLQNLCGSFKYGSLTGTFQGITPLKQEQTGEVIPGFWSISHTVWGPDAEMEEEGQQLWVTQEEDDNKHRFVGMYLTTGFCGWAHTAACDVVGKKQRDGCVDGEGLSNEELDRLGLDEEDNNSENDDEDEGEDGEEDEEDGSEGENEQDGSEDDDEDEEDENGSSDQKDKDVAADDNVQGGLVKPPSEEVNTTFAAQISDSSRKRKALESADTREGVKPKHT
ncbi:hypothetical protein C0991_007671 [Blastosporella zonata]|nr:hypothetical protein C0991_007671 [Blastosporella zonata]